MRAYVCNKTKQNHTKRRKHADCPRLFLAPFWARTRGCGLQCPVLFAPLVWTTIIWPTLKPEGGHRSVVIVLVTTTFALHPARSSGRWFAIVMCHWPRPLESPRPGGGSAKIYGRACYVATSGASNCLFVGMFGPLVAIWCAFGRLSCWLGSVARASPAGHNMCRRRGVALARQASWQANRERQVARHKARARAGPEPVAAGPTTDIKGDEKVYLQNHIQI